MIPTTIVKRISAFAFGLLFGVVPATVFQGMTSGNVEFVPNVVSEDVRSQGNNLCPVTAKREDNKAHADSKVTGGLIINSVPQPGYTDNARENNEQGTVTLRITLLASGQIGSVEPISQLNYGLTEKAIEAARSIEFEPAIRDGIPVSVTVQIGYDFSID